MERKRENAFYNAIGGSGTGIVGFCKENASLQQGKGVRKCIFQLVWRG